MDELLPENIRDYLNIQNISYRLLPCDPEYGDTEGLVLKYGYPKNQITNTIIAVGRTEPRTYVACVVLATHKIDMNKRVRKLLGAKSASFASGEETESKTAMTVGGITAFGLPKDIPVWIDGEVFDRPEVLLGGGNRSVKILVNPNELLKITGVRKIDGLGLKRVDS